MNRVALTETFWRRSTGSDLVSFAHNYQVHVYKRGTEEPASLYSSEVGGEEVAQPLTTDEGGRVRGAGNVLGWLEPGSYDIVVNGQRIPFEAAQGGALGLSEAAVIAAAESVLGSLNAVVFKGVIDCSANPNYPAASAGELYRISVAGKIGGGAGVNVEAGDSVICLSDGTAAGTQAAVGAKWGIIQANLDGAVIGPAAATDGNITVFSGATGKQVKDGGVTVAKLATKAEVEILNLGTDWSAGDLLGAQITSPPVPHKLDLRDGSSASPVKIGVTASLSRVDETTRAELNAMGPEGTDGHDGATIFRSTIKGTAASEVQISCAVLTATQLGAYGGQFADATPLIARARVSGAATGRAIAGYLESDIETETARGGQALELRVKNTSGVPHTYAQGAGSKSMGIYVNASGGQAAAAVQVGHGAGQQFDVAFAINEEAVKTASFIDNSSSLRSILVKGSHEKAAIAVKEGAGQVIIGSELPNQATPIFEVYSETAKDPVASLASTDKAVNISGQLARNSAGNVKAFASSGANQFLTGTAAGDTGFGYTPGKGFHIGATGKTSMFRLEEAKIGFYGVAPVARAGAIASPGETVAALKIAVDALRVALTNVGITS